MSSSLKINKAAVLPWVCAVLLFIISYPKWLWGQSERTITYASLLLLVIVFKDIQRNKRFLAAGLIVLLFQMYIVWVTGVFRNTNINGRVMVILKGIGFASIFLCSTSLWKKTTDCFIKILAFLLIPTVIEHVFASFLGTTFVAPSYFECPTNPGRMYTSFLFNVYLNKTFDYFGRFYAFYDEPGVLGNIMMILLYIQRFDLKKWHNVVFLIAGVLSFSLTFYVAIALYYFVFGKIRAKIGFALGLIVAVYYFFGNEFIYDYIFRRVSFENGQMIGYNREHYNFNSWYSTVHWDQYLFWGYKPRDIIPYAASWKWAFAIWGIIPSLLYMFFLARRWTKKIPHKKDILIAMALMAIVWIQRPFVYQYLYVFMIAIPFIYFSDDDEKNDIQTYQ